jgi:hypothetical protein
VVALAADVRAAAQAEPAAQAVHVPVVAPAEQAVRVEQAALAEPAEPVAQAGPSRARSLR